MAETTLTSDSANTINVVLIGNPNTGKTTLFNALTGLRHRVGNYPGVTVETKTGAAHIDGQIVQVTDVPGTYSLSPRSPDEMLAVDLLLGLRPDASKPAVVVCILDASNLERNLYLATQVLELGIPTVLALNMIDVAERLGVTIDVAKLSGSLGVPVVLTQANKKRGISDLLRAVLAVRGRVADWPRPAFPEPFQKETRELAVQMQARGHSAANIYLIERAILDAGGFTETTLSSRFGGEITALLAASRSRLNAGGCPIPAIEALSRYSWIAGRLEGAVTRPKQRPKTITDRIDRILIHRVWGLAAFVVLMAVVFQSIYTWAGPLMAALEQGFAMFGSYVGTVLPDGPLRGLIVDGVIGGMGAVLVFLPQIAILFGFVAILEDCGYMARAAFLMDKIMSRCGLSGKSFIPMLSSFACAVPGVMAARTIEDRRDRLTTIMVAPLMSCSARLPVYLLLIAAFVPNRRLLGLFSLQAAVLLAMYMIGLLVAPLVAWALKATVLRGDAPVFLMELPSYKWPSAGTVAHRMYDRGKAFVRRAGTLILATSVVIWALQYYPRSNKLDHEYQMRIERLEAALASPVNNAETIRAEIIALENECAALQQSQSFLGQLGQAIEPAVRPLGWDWRIGMAAIASFPAREVVIAALGTIYHVGDNVDVGDAEGAGRLQSALQAAVWPDGSPVFNVPVALSLMVFFALCCQCAATLAVIKRETNSWRWPILTFVYMTTLAYFGALAVYQIGMYFA